jgi:hypothetical protein
MNWLADQPADLAVWVANARGRLAEVHAAGESWPVTLGAGDQGPAATWLTSLASALIGTPKDEIVRGEGHGLGGTLLAQGLGLAEHLAVAMGIGGAAIVNNSLLSVSPVGPSGVAAVGSALAAAARRWPERIVAARGIVAPLDAVRGIAHDLGGVAFPNRVSYVFDMTGGKTPEKINAVRDAALLRKANLDVISHEEFTAGDLAAAHAQYSGVYITRHGGRNPRFTPAFIDAVHARGAARFWGLRKDGALAAFVALRDHGDFDSVPLIGYPIDADPKFGLYRQIFALALDVGAREKKVINFGAGAGHYKKLRGAVPAIEYVIIVPSRTTALGWALASLLSASQARLNQVVPQAIAAYGG